MKRTGKAAAVLATAVLATAGLAGGLLVAAVPSALAASTTLGFITTAAGGAGRGVAGEVAQTPLSVAAGPGGAVYVGDVGVVREFTSISSLEHVVAGIGYDGVGGTSGHPATQTAVGDISGEAVDPAGNLVIANDQPYGTVRVVATATGTFYGQPMTAGDIYTLAQLPYAYGVATDGSGNVVISTAYHEHVVVYAASTGTFYGQAMTAGHVYTIAGTGKKGDYGNGVPALSANLNFPQGLAVDGAGNVVFADTDSNRIRVIAASTGTFYGKAMTAGDIYTITGNGKRGYSGDGGPAAEAMVNHPNDVAVDNAGNVLIADTTNSRIRVIAASTGTFYGQPMTAGDIYTIAGNGTGGYSGDGGPGTLAMLGSPYAVAADQSGNVLIGDTLNRRVRVLAGTSGTFYGEAMTAGDIYTIAGNGNDFYSGDGGPARDAELLDDGGLAMTGSGDLAISDADSSRIRLVAGSSGSRFGQAMTAGDIYTIAGTGTAGYSGDGGPGTAAELNGPGGVAADSAGNVLSADWGNNRVRVVAASSGTFYGQAMTAGDIYTIAGSSAAGYSGDGGPATAAELNGPAGLAVDAQGNVLINDSGNARVRVVAAASGTFYGQAMTAGDIYTVAGDGTAGYSGDGGPATAAELNSTGIDMAGLAVDHSGNVIITDFRNNRVRVVAAASGTFYGQAMTAGDIYTIAGDGTAGYSGDGGPATSATLSASHAVTVDNSGNVIISDGGNSRVRVVAVSSGSFYGQAMTAGDIYTIAGNGKAGFAGDGGPGPSARVFVPEGVAVDSAGDVLIADSGNLRVRMVFG
jgi:trimeric autotransporter adhesin